MRWIRDAKADDALYLTYKDSVKLEREILNYLNQDTEAILPHDSPSMVIVDLSVRHS